MKNNLCSLILISIIFSFSNADYSYSAGEDNSMMKASGYQVCDNDYLKEAIIEYKKAGLNEFLNEISLILMAKQEFKNIHRKLAMTRIKWIREHGRGFGKQIPVLENMKNRLGQIKQYIQEAIQGFETQKKNVVNTPEKLIGQLIQVKGLLNVLETGDVIEGSLHGYDVDLVRQRMDLALKYAIIWAQEGFK